MVKYLVAGFFVLMACLNVANSTTTVPAQISLQSLEMQQTSEEVDELYLHVVAYPSKDHPYHFRLPAFPNYWRSTHVQHIKDLKILDTQIANGESLMLVVSLLEHDVPPWNNDDFVGAFKLHLKAEDGKLIHEWKKPNAEKDQAKMDGDASSQTQSFTFSGNNSKYILNLALASSSEDQGLRLPEEAL